MKLDSQLLEMTDTELLELAARVAEMIPKEFVGNHNYMKGVLERWNPLTNNGDALWLAVKIGMRDYFGLEVQKSCVQATCFEPWEHCEYEEYKTQDPCAATRRAIVRVAAEIGKEKNT
jgi:hypothetical protein